MAPMKLTFKNKKKKKKISMFQTKITQYGFFLPKNLEKKENKSGNKRKRKNENNTKRKNLKKKK